MARHAGFTLDEVHYEGYTQAVINDNGDVQCPKCASLSQTCEYEVKKYGLWSEYSECTYCTKCESCDFRYCFHLKIKKGGL